MPSVTFCVWKVSAFGKFSFWFFRVRYNAKADGKQTNALLKSDEIDCISLLHDESFLGCGCGSSSEAGVASGP